MSISFNHPKNIVTSTGSLNLVVSGGSTTAPQPIRFSSTSVIMPVRPLPAGEAGAMVFDSSSKLMKYHNGIKWIDILDADEILAPVEVSLTDIYNRLNRKVESVTYSTSAVPNASISGTNLNIVFPTGGGSGTGPTGLFTSSKPGCIQYYALTSGQTVASIREQMSGVTNGQSGRAGTQASPWVTSDGWCLADGMWWTWAGQNGTITKQVPNLNNEAYLKTMSLSGLTKTDSRIAASGNTSSVALSIAQLPPHNFTVSGQTAAAGEHVHQMPLTDDRSGTGRADGGNPNRVDGSQTTSSSGNHIHTFSGTTNTVGSGQGHAHTLSSVDVDHYNVAALYNIAESSVALSETVANSRYVLKAGDTMTGSLTIASSASIKGNDTGITLFFRNSSNGERAAITHNSTNNTLRLRSSGGSEVQVNSTGGMVIPGTLSLTGAATLSSTLTVTGNAVVQGKNVVRSVNGTNADASGNVTITTSNTTALAATNGWSYDSNTRILTQWGIQPTGGNGSFNVTFPRAFGQVYTVQCTRIGLNNSPTVAVHTVNSTGFVLKQADGGEGGSYWTAIGFL